MNVNEWKYESFVRGRARCSETQPWQPEGIVDNSTSNMASSRLVRLVAPNLVLRLLGTYWIDATSGSLSNLFVVTVNAIVVVLEHSFEQSLDVNHCWHSLPFALEIVDLVVEGRKPVRNRVNLSRDGTVRLVDIALDDLHRLVNCLLQLRDGALPITRLVRSQRLRLDREKETVQKAVSLRLSFDYDHVV